MKWNRILALLLFLFSQFALAAGGHEAQDPHAIPVKTIFVQGFNFILLVGLLVYLLRPKIKQLFADRAKTYNDLVERAELAKREAEKSKASIQQRLMELKNTSQKSLEQARGDASELRNKLLNEARTLSEKMQFEAQSTARLEIERAKQELRADLLEAALELSKKSLQEKVNPSEQKRLQSEFVEKIQVVR